MTAEKKYILCTHIFRDRSKYISMHAYWKNQNRGYFIGKLIDASCLSSNFKFQKLFHTLFIHLDINYFVIAPKFYAGNFYVAACNDHFAECSWNEMTKNLVKWFILCTRDNKSTGSSRDWAKNFILPFFFDDEFDIT